MKKLYKTFIKKFKVINFKKSKILQIFCIVKGLKKVLITGITGQTGSFSRVFVELGYEVHGIIRRSSLIKTDRIDPIFKSLNLHYGDMTDGMNLMSIIDKVKPHEIYNLVAQSHVMVSFETPEYTANADGLGALRILEIINKNTKKLNFSS